MSASTPARVRAQLAHPIVDSDGHTLEFEPAVLEVLRRVAGPGMVERYRQSAGDGLLQWLLSKDDFRAFTFENPVHFWTALRPDFFEGTNVESAARALRAALPEEG